MAEFSDLKDVVTMIKDLLNKMRIFRLSKRKKSEDLISDIQLSDKSTILNEFMKHSNPLKYRMGIYLLDFGNMEKISERSQ